MASLPLTDTEFAGLLAGLGMPETEAPFVACSGGPDSMALARLCRDWARARGMRAAAAVVDHGLRPDAAAEAARVADTLRREGLDADVLTHGGPRPTRDVQASARDIRYRLLADWMAQIGHRRVMLAHHQEDQAETVLLRLARGSGVDGLSAMAPVSERDGMLLLRPLLGIPKARLAATVLGWPIETDPSNRDRAFARVRMRGLADVLAAEGLTPSKLAATAARMARARAALDAARDAFLGTHATLDPAGYALLPPDALVDLPEEVGLRVLSQMIRVLGGRVHPPREEKLVALHRTVTARGGALSGRVLAGARIAPWRGSLLICREQAGIEAPRVLTRRAAWDGRFRVELCEGAEVDGCAVAKLGRDGVTRLRAEDGPAKAALAAMPGAVRPTLPAVWRDGCLVAAPHLGVTPLEGPPGSIGFRSVSAAWGEAFQRRLPFSSGAGAPI